MPTLSHEGSDLLIELLAIFVPVIMTVIVGLLAFSVMQTIGRVNDKIKSVQYELTEHKESCNRVDKGVLQTRIEGLEREVFGK